MDKDFKIDTFIGPSTIAGNGRFFNENVKKGTIIREQKINSPSLLKFDNENELMNYISLNKDLEKIRHFFHTTPSDSKFYKNSVFLNNPYMFTNHSFNPNIYFEYTENYKYTITSKDVKIGDEMFQDYLNFSKVNWFENFLKEHNFTSSREFAFNLKKKS